ncbi:very short patch repair endonuclease [Mycolicibacterium hassiacum]|nr:very short patch repair endonuclease [Mycolicibacterium hassiacum]
MQANRRRDTKPELRVRRLAHALGLRYRVDYRPLATERFKADMVFTGAKVAVFIDGCFWHGCKQHHRPPTANSDYWRSKIAGNVMRDALVDAHLEKNGWVSLRFWEHDDPEVAVQQILATVTSRRRLATADVGR